MTSTFSVIAVAGGTGNTVGPHIVKHLLNKKYTVKVLSRQTEKTFPGAQMVLVDYANVESLTTALQGVDAVISTIGGAGLLDAQKNLVLACSKAQVKRFYPSEFGIDVSDLTSKELAFAPVKQQIRQVAKEQNLNCVCIVTGFFYSMFVPPFGFHLAQNMVNLVGDGHTRVSFAYIDDIAQYTVASLECANLPSDILYLDSDMLTWNEVVQLLNAKHNTTLQVSHTCIEDAQLKNDGSFASILLQLQILAAQGKIANRKSHASLFPQVKPTKLVDHLAK